MILISSSHGNLNVYIKFEKHATAFLVITNTISFNKYRLTQANDRCGTERYDHFR